jgi:diguanylate cyclase (GGDEF)-like protein
MTALPRPNAAVLVIDDDDVSARLAQIHLERNGFVVEIARTGEEGLRHARQRPPELVLSSAHLPDMDGLTIVRLLAEENRTRHIPLILMASQPRPRQMLEALEGGADDYLVRPLDAREMVARVKAHVRRAQLKPALSPLTGLPGNLIIEQEIRRLTEPGGGLFAVLYLDVNNFKAYNDVYGFPAGDEALRMLAGVLTNAVAEMGNPSDLVGHIGGDDFVVITTPDRADAIAQSIIADFDRQAPDLYTPTDRRNGYITAKDRQGLVKKFPLLGVVIAIVHNEHHPIASHWEVGELGAELKHYAKGRSGSNYVKDQRRG